MGRRARPRARRACSGEAAARASSRSRWAASEGGSAGLHGAGPAKEDRLVEGPVHRVEVGGEVEVQPQVRVVGEHGHTIARRERGDEVLRLADGPEEPAQAAALEVLLEEEDDESARRRGGRRGVRRRERPGDGRRLRHPHRRLQGRAPAVDLQPEVGRAEAGQGPAARVRDAGLEHDARGLDAGEDVGGLLSSRCGGEEEPKGPRPGPERIGHRGDASTRATAALC